MPSSATVTSYNTFIANTRAKSSEVNTNFSIYRGHNLPIDPNNPAAIDNTYDLGSTEYRWRSGYFGTSLFVGGNRVDRARFQSITQTTTAEAGFMTYLADASTACGVILPYGSGATGSVTKIKKIGATGNPVWVQPATTTALIDGLTSTTIPNRNAFASFLYDGSNYYLVEEGGPQNLTTSATSFSGTIGGAGLSSGILDLSIPVSANACGYKGFTAYLHSGETVNGSTLVILRTTTTTQQLGFNATLSRDGVEVSRVICDLQMTTSLAMQLPVEWIRFSDLSVPAGQHTWTVKMTQNAGNANQLRIAGNCFLRVEEGD
jgi:hypothetical protein